MLPDMDTSRLRPLAVVGLATKAALAALLALAVIFPDWDRFADKAMGARVAAYPAAVMLVTFIWALRGRGKPFPWDVDILVTAPFLIDVGGNAADLYDSVGWFDDACHFANWALLCAAAGLALRRWGGLRSWTLAVSCTGIGAVAAIAWEFIEYGLFILDTPEAVTAYRDTIGDLMLGLSGAALAALTLAAAPARTPVLGKTPVPEHAVSGGRGFRGRTLVSGGTPVPGGASVDEGLDVVQGDLLDVGRRPGDADAREDVVRPDVAAGRALRAEGDAPRGEDHRQQVVQGSGVRQ